MSYESVHGSHAFNEMSAELNERDDRIAESRRQRTHSIQAAPEVSTIRSTTSVHHVVRIESERVVFSDFVSHAFRFIDANGGVVEVSAFSDAPIDIVTMPDRSAA
jgi:hypothetical protein